MEKNNKDNFLIIDSNSVIHRAFHALPPLADKDGTVVNAVYGFLLVLFKAIKDYNPKYIAACFDLPEPTFRKKAFSEYKAKREKAPDELYNQIPLVKKTLKAFNISVFEKSGFEGDDLIGTLAEFTNQKYKNKIHNIIASGDLDNLQLVNDNTNVYFLSRGVKEGALYNEEMIKQRYDGLLPQQIIFFKALRGDASDNIPGVKGIGEKTAIQLVKEYGDLDNIYKEAEKENSQIKQSIKEKLLKDKDMAYMSFELVKIKRDVPIDVAIMDCEWEGFDKDKAQAALENFGFKSLIKKIPGMEIEEDEKKKIIGENLKLW
ncbi:MAG: 5'-3' exonuclease H3TH domain-containing protein [Candidatus Paceibacterota bacterium]|jgi:DNA polymerase-1